MVLELDLDDAAASLDGCDVFNYQLDRHCSKTRLFVHQNFAEFNYQLDRHCSKTIEANSPLRRDGQASRYNLSMFKKLQVNNQFMFVFVRAAIVFILK